jgi:hypothetical protein
MILHCSIDDEKSRCRRLVVGAVALMVTLTKMVPLKGHKNGKIFFDLATSVVEMETEEVLNDRTNDCR